MAPFFTGDGAGMAKKKVAFGRPPRAKKTSDQVIRYRCTADEKKLVTKLAEKLTGGDVSALLRLAVQRLAESEY